MRIVVLTDKNERHYHFANRLIAETGQVVGVITGGKYVKKSGGTVQRWKKLLWNRHGLERIRNGVMHLFLKRYGDRLFAEKKEAEQAAFGGSKEFFLKTHKDLLLAHVEAPYASVNDAHYVALLRAAKPDVIVVMGTTLLKKEIMGVAPLMINIHTGLSPYYRGGYTNLWPILEKDFGYFGVTVHKMSLGIDAGEIFYTARPEIHEDDTYGSINSRCITLGIDLMKNALTEHERGTLRSLPQWTKGKLFHNRDVNDWVAYRYAKERAGFLSEYCTRAAAHTLDVVQLVTNGVPISSENA